MLLGRGGWGVEGGGGGGGGGYTGYFSFNIFMGLRTVGRGD